MARVKVIRTYQHGVGGKLLVKLILQPFWVVNLFPYQSYPHNPDTVAHSSSHTSLNTHSINGVSVGLVETFQPSFVHNLQYSLTLV